MSSSQIDRPLSTADLSQDNLRGIDRVVNVLGRARRLLFITGAGMSADSGLPTYRGRDGLYRAHQSTQHGLSIEQALSGPMLRLRPDITWHYLLELERSTRGAMPNRGHHVLAEMDRYFDDVWILTQNVDGLHQFAGSRNVLDVHGNLHELECMRCGLQSTAENYTQLSLPPRCPACEGLIRPSVVLFGEELPQGKLERLWYEFGMGFDAIFSIGTSSLFEYIIEPVRMGQAMGIPTVEINPEPTTVSDLVDVR
ncbi:MAG TPA: NAD-dependent protein deacylase, partial [Isosphaeraceae bacterium]|nr:NAD-dependent protein deacylase [Isosphaeraceae bacterium]